MKKQGADEVVLETEINNFASLALYEKLGFVRSRLLKRYYMNGVDAYRLKYFITRNIAVEPSWDTGLESHHNVEAVPHGIREQAEVKISGI